MYDLPIENALVVDRTNARFLVQFVRQRRLVALEEAVRKMPSLPAGRLGLTRRGRIAPGRAAGPAVFSPQEAAGAATFDGPHRYSTPRASRTWW